MSVETRPLLDGPVPSPSPVVAHPAVKQTRKSKRLATEEQQRGIVSPADLQSPRVRRKMGAVNTVLLVILIIWGLAPMLWLAKASITPTEELYNHPMALWPTHATMENLRTAWHDLQLGLYFKNTLVIAFGSWFAQIFVATTGGYALSVLRPRYAKVLNAMIISTLFIPAIVLLVPLYLIIVKVPILHWSLINQYWAIWLPAGANAFNIVLMKRFFDNLPREIFEAARMDGAGPFKLFWSIVLPMSKPIIGVVSVFAFIAAWKDFLWPLLVIEDATRQPLSVRLATISALTEQSVLIAALFISTLLPIFLFIIFQRVFLRGSGLSGALKG